MKRKVRKIAVIYGCDSSEWEISCRSGEFVSSQIDGAKYDVYEIFARFGHWSLVAYRLRGCVAGSVSGVAGGIDSASGSGPIASEAGALSSAACGIRVVIPEGSRPQIDKTDFSVVLGGEKVKFDFAYIMQHGTPGENGLMQGYLEMLGIPYSSCSAFVSTVAFDKFSCKSYLRDVDFVKCADDVMIRRGDSLVGLASAVVSKLGLPLFVKPTDGGSSFGVTKVKRVEDFDKAVEDAFAEGSTVLAEKAIVGRELTCAVYRDGGRNVALPVVEIVTDHEFFDYDAKYNGFSDEICPADIPEETAAMIRDASVRIYSRLGCSGCVRMDYILAQDGLYFLEINTIPGMTAASLVPKMVRTAGMRMTDFLTTIIQNAQ